ncbi:MAG: hypothetical protein JNK82_20030 [Myxococcaceae bacterium]|nr:hypothetical protein [Myxococcaceae bacterium]
MLTLISVLVMAAQPCAVVLLAKNGPAVTQPAAQELVERTQRELSGLGVDVLPTAERKRIVPGDPRCVGEVNDACISQLASVLEASAARAFVALEVAGTANVVALSFKAVDLERRLVLGSATVSGQRPLPAEAFRAPSFAELAEALRRTCREPAADAAPARPAPPPAQPTLQPPSASPAPVQAEAKEPARAPSRSFFGVTVASVTAAALGVATGVLGARALLLRDELYRGSTVTGDVRTWGWPESRVRELEGQVNTSAVATLVLGATTLLALMLALYLGLAQ